MQRNPLEHPADLHWIVYVLFFALGCITSLNDVIIPKLKALFVLPYVKIMLIQAAFFAAFLVVALPASWLVRRIGYMRTAVLGLLTMSAGCLLFAPASHMGYFALFLAALFVIAAGITTVQVMINPLMSMLGDAATTQSRLSFSQAFYSLGTTISPYFGALLILGGGAVIAPEHVSDAMLGAFRTAETRMIEHIYLGIACVVLALAAGVWLRRHRLVELVPDEVHVSQGFALFRASAFCLWRALHIFLCRRGNRDRLDCRQLPDAAERHGLVRAGGRPAPAVLLGRRHGGAISRRLLPQENTAGQGAHGRRRSRDGPAGDVRKYDGRCLGVGVARYRAL